MIHACNNRLWYVKDFLLPSIIEQGCHEEDVILWNDTDNVGCLKNFVRSCDYIVTNEDPRNGIWHVQDDVCLCGDFVDRCKTLSEMNIIVNGFTSSGKEYSNSDFIGMQPVNKFWYSFQCTYIPNMYIRGFYTWFLSRCIRDGVFEKRVRENKHEDFLFWKYMNYSHKNEKIFNCAPNLVEHVDCLLGGSVVSANAKKRVSRYWNDNEIVLKLKNDINVSRGTSKRLVSEVTK